MTSLLDDLRPAATRLRRPAVPAPLAHVAVAAVAVTATFAVAAPAEAAQRDCGAFGAGARVIASNVSCKTARSVAKYASTHNLAPSVGNGPKGPTGWTCARGIPDPEASQAEGFTCERRSARVVVRSAPPIWAGDQFEERFRKPKTFAVAVTAALLDLRWTGWDSPTATGRGRFGERGQSLGRATIRLSRPKRCDGVMTYTAGRYRVGSGPWRRLRADSACRLGV